MSFGATQKGSDGVPLSSAIVPGNQTPIPLSGSALTTTDANGNTITPVNLNLLQIGSVLAQMGVQDGVTPSNLLELGTMLYNGGGPVLANGTPSLLAFDRLRSFTGMGSQNGTITSTTAGDTSLTFSVAPKTITPGAKIKLSGGASIEYVIVAQSFVVSATATVVPLVSPVVNSGQTTAAWAVSAGGGPSGGAWDPSGTLPVISGVYDNLTGNIYTVRGNQGTLIVDGTSNNTSVPANTAANLVVKSSAGLLGTMTVTTLGTAALSFFDNSTTNSGTVLFTIPASAAVGTIYKLDGWAKNGIVAAGVSNCPGVTVYFN